ncbi:MAG: hypothetical protein H7196_04975 [candidate division SR1 bacterium]|nr:hypothetical protein [candidate division SR1 bacterium]
MKYKNKTSSLLPQNIENTQTIKGLLKSPIKSYANVDCPKFGFEYSTNWKIKEYFNEGENYSPNDSGYVIKLEKDNSVLKFNEFNISDYGPIPIDCTDEDVVISFKNGWSRIKYLDKYMYFRNISHSFYL